ncbi:MAG: metallophosphoesterase, partial [Candidatus Roizmanbacteria bacterium]|nr:metallophosphoesterase [Candidatus Roizmanbacteria bacterium]
MNILVFSDTHLYLPFDQIKFDFLKKIISQSGQVIINGDFFDDYMISFDEFINSPWNQLFPLLKNKHAVYIFGNHDQQKFSDKRMNLFSDIQAPYYHLSSSNYHLVFTHGHQFRKTADLSIKNILNIMPIVNLVMNIAHFFRQVMVNIFGRNFLRFRFAYRNIATKRKAIKTIKENEFIIIGHNHWAEVDEKNRFACCGAILYGFAQYLTIDS